MWSRLNRRAALMGLMALGACGFTPIYGPNGAAQDLRGAIEVVTPSTLAGYQLGTSFIERFGPATDPRFVLEVTIEETQSAAAETIDGDTTRFDLNGMARWVLRDASGPVADGLVQTFSSYSATGSTLATQTAERNARERLSVAMADLIVADVILANR